MPENLYRTLLKGAIFHKIDVNSLTNIIDISAYIFAGKYFKSWLSFSLSGLNSWFVLGQVVGKTRNVGYNQDSVCMETNKILVAGTVLWIFN